MPSKIYIALMMIAGLLFIVFGCIDMSQGVYSFASASRYGVSRGMSPILALVFGVVLFFVSLRNLLIKKKR